jgi:plastocyanin
MKYTEYYVFFVSCCFIGILVSCSNAPSQPEALSLPEVVAASSSSLAAIAAPPKRERSSRSSAISSVDVVLKKQNILSSSAISIKKTSSASHLSASHLSVSHLNKSATVTGVIKVIGKNGEMLSADNTIVNLEPLDKTLHPKNVNALGEHKVNMINKSYSPKVLTVMRNETMRFFNRDKIKHNVFSTSGKNSFDLGTYGEGADNKVSLKNAGIVKVYCNIHPEMVSVISVSDYNYSAITTQNGNYSVGNLPAGEYTLSVWNIRGETQKKITLESGKALQVDLQIDAAAYVPVSHKNKYGEAYKVKSALFDDEFY